MKVLFKILFFCHISFFTYSQSRFEDVKLQSLSVKDGLSQSNVNWVTKDHEGFIWIATDDGLNRFDSYEFKVFKHFKNDSSSISDNRVWCVFEDSKKRLWVGANQGGLNLFDRSTNSFSHIKHDPNDKNTITDGGVYCILEDHKNRLWIGTLNGLNVYDIEKEQITRISTETEGELMIPNDQVHALMEDHQGRIWAGTNKGVCVIDFENKNISHYQFEPGNPNSICGNRVKSIFQDSQNEIWIGTEGGGVSLFDAETGGFKTFKFDPFGVNSISSNTVRDIIEDENDNIWFGTDGGGISIYNRSEQKFAKITSKGDQGFKNAAVYHLYEDDESKVWIGTYGDGLKILDKRRTSFHHYEVFNQVMSTLGKKSVLAITEGKDKEVWIGTDGSGLFRFNPETKEFKHFFHDPKDPESISGNVIKSLLVDQKGNIYAGTYAAGLNIIDPKSYTIKKFKPDPMDPKSINSLHVWAMGQDSQGRIWIGTLGGGLNEFIPEKSEFIAYVNDEGDPHSISYNNITKIYEDRFNKLWIATEGGGLNLFDKNTGQFKRFIHDESRPATCISNNIVKDIFEDRDGRMWVGTNGGGLNYYDREEGIFKVHEAGPELNEAILSILEDQDGNLWMSSYIGLIKYNPGSDYTRVYDVHDGLQGNEFNANSKLHSSDGKFYFGGLNGFNVFDPEDIKENQNIPPLAFTDFYLFHKEVAIGSELLPTDINQLEEITILPDHKVVTFKFAALDFSLSHKNKYAYLLEGFDNEWNHIEGDRQATYTNIPPGSYTFRVKTSNNDGVWSGGAKSIHVNVIPPWYNRLWVKILMAFILILLVLLFIRIRTNILLNQKHRLELEVKRRIRQIEMQKEEIQEKNIALEDQNKKILDQNHQLTSKNNEILLKNEQIRDKSILLEKAHSELKVANDQLKKINIDLENLVDSRTSELKNTINRLIQTDEELNTFIYRSSHDLRGPITSLLGLAQLIEKENGDPRLIPYVDRAKESCYRMLKFLKKLKDTKLVFSNAKIRKKIFWQALFDEVISQIEEINNQRNVDIKIINHLEDDVFTDPSTLKIIIVNLLENAIIFSDLEKPSPRADLSISTENNQLLISVYDNGKGINEEIQEKLFKLFYRGSEASIGNGLGLFLVQKAVKKLNGEIILKSGEGEYTKVTVKIPLINPKKSLNKYFRTASNN